MDLHNEKRVIVKLTGGLGNQLFQYAAAKALSIRNGADVWIDRSFYSDQSRDDIGHRNFLLGNLRIGGLLLSPDEEKLVNTVFSGSKLKKLLVRSFRPILKNAAPRIWMENQQRIFGDPTIPAEGLYMVGNWQDHTLFDGIREVLKEEMVPKAAPPSSVNHLLELINSSASVAVHVRRGDYLNERVRKIHGVLPAEYYQMVLDSVRETNPHVKFFFFSDDPLWVRTHLAVNYRNSEVVSYPEQIVEPFWDIELMRHCKSHVIANSTFSWWGAYLSRSKPQAVYVPGAWIKNPVNRRNNLLPEGWLIT